MENTTKQKIIRVTTIPGSLGGLLKGQLRNMSKNYEVIGISSPGDGSSLGNYHLERVATQEGIKVIPVKMTRKITPLQDLKAAWKLYRIFKKEKPFIVHTHTPKAGTLGMFAAFFARVPHRLHTIAGMPLMEATGTKRVLLDMVEKATYFCATKIYPNSFGLKDFILKNRYTRQDKLKVIGNGSSNGIDTNHFDPILVTSSQKEQLRISLGIHPDDFVFIFVGRLVKDKGVNELVSAFQQLNSSFSNTKLLLVGFYEEYLDPLLPETIECITTNPDILMVGTQKDVRPYYSISNVLAFPSYREGFPNVVMEAGSMGLPSIVTNINGCNEIIIQGENGCLIPPKDQERLFNVMYLIYVKYRCGYLPPTRTIRDMIIARYSRPKVWAAILNEYRTMAQTKEPVKIRVEQKEGSFQKLEHPINTDF
jgi:glycosyltransferase involved in cell wall biosynthesis